MAREGGANRSERERLCARRVYAADPSVEGRAIPCGMTTHAAEEWIMDLVPEEARAVLLYLGHRYPFEVTQALDAVTGKQS